MKVHQITRARTLSFALAAIGLGAAVIAAGASADFRSVHDPRGDSRCFHDAGGDRPCTDAEKRNTDIVRATAGHDGRRLRHTIRVVGKVQRGSLSINTDSDPECSRAVYFQRGNEIAKIQRWHCGDGGPSTGRASFHRHSVEISFSKRSIGNPPSYDWLANVCVGPLAGHACDHVPRHLVKHRLGDAPAATGVMALGAQTAAVPSASAKDVFKTRVEVDSTVTLPPPQKNPFYGRVESSKHACEVDRLVEVYRVTPGRDHVADGGDAIDRTNQRGKWRNTQLILGAGRFYAKVVRRKPAGTTFDCRQDRSPTRHVQHQG